MWLLLFQIPVIADLPVGSNMEDHLLFLFRQKINQSYGINSDTMNNSLAKLQYNLLGKGNE